MKFRLFTVLRALGLGAAVLLIHATAVLAAEKELLDVLLSNGAINQTQYDELLAKEEITKEDVEDVVVQLGSGGLEIGTADGEFEINIGARLHAQASINDRNLPAGYSADDGVELRRARLELDGKAYRDWTWVAEVDFADNDIAVKDFWLGYDVTDWLSVHAGHQKQAYGLSIEESSNDIAFIERGIDDDLNFAFVDRAVGLRADANGEHWFVATGIYGESMEPTDNNDDGFGATLRVVVAPIIEEDRVLHLGVHSAYRDPSGSGETRIRTETTHMSSLYVVDTGNFDTESTTLVGGEAAGAWGPASFNSEYSHALINRDDARNLSFFSWHVAAALSLTGETLAKAYRIDSGEFKRLIPKNNFSWANRTWGAWEAAARVAAIDAKDHDIVGGEETVLTTGLNWYPNLNIRLMFEWSRILDTDQSSDLRRAAQGMNIFQMRTQYTF